MYQLWICAVCSHAVACWSFLRQELTFTLLIPIMSSLPLQNVHLFTVRLQRGEMKRHGANELYGDDRPFPYNLVTYLCCSFKERICVPLVFISHLQNQNKTQGTQL